MRSTVITGVPKEENYAIFTMQLEVEALFGQPIDLVICSLRGIDSMMYMGMFARLTAHAFAILFLSLFDPPSAYTGVWGHNYFFLLVHDFRVRLVYGTMSWIPMYHCFGGGLYTYEKKQIHCALCDYKITVTGHVPPLISILFDMR